MSGYVPTFEYDLFISYEHAEDPAWIQTFVKSLSDQLSSQHGIKASIWQDKNHLDVGENWETEIEKAIKRSAILLAVLSPGYKNSEWCMKECEIFQEFLVSRGEQLEKSNRFFKVVKTPWEDDEHLHFWATIEHLELFRRNDRKDIEPFSFGSNDFQFAIRSVASSVERTLRRLRRQRERVVVASPAKECQAVWKELRKELHVKGYDVQPEGFRNYAFGDPLILKEFKDALLSVHLLGTVYDEFFQHQIQLAADLEQRLMFWLASDVEAVDAEQARLIAALRNGHRPDRPDIELPSGWEFLPPLTPRGLMEAVLEALKPQPQDLPPPPRDLPPQSPRDMSPPPPRDLPHPPPASGASGAPRIYIVHDSTTQEDARIAATLQEEIHTREKMEVILSRADLPSSAELQLRHRMLLQTCDGVLLCRKAAPQEWLVQVAPEVLLADQLLRRQEPIKSKAFLVPDPASWSEWPKIKVIPYSPQFQPGDLEPFLAPLRAEGSVAHGR
jgi:hypothetical protein